VVASRVYPLAPEPLDVAENRGIFDIRFFREERVDAVSVDLIVGLRLPIVNVENVLLGGTSLGWVNSDFFFLELRKRSTVC
jgi:hypothetical protein